MQRRRYSTEFKQQVIQECIESGSPSVVGRKHDLNPDLVARWVRQSKKDGLASKGKQLSSKGYVTLEEHKQLAEVKTELASENEQLKKALAEQALEVSILRDLLKKHS